MQGTQEQIQKCQNAISRGMEFFKNQNRELLASIAQDVTPSLWAAIRLDENLQKELEAGDLYAFKRYSDIFERVFLNLLDRRVVTHLDFTDAGLQTLYTLRRKHNIGAESVPPPELTAIEKLEAEVIADFNGACSTTQMRKKMNDPAYRDVYNRLAQTDRLASRVTSAIVAGA